MSATVVGVIGLVAMFFGFTMLLGPLGVIADVVPFFGSIVRTGTGFAAFLLTAVVGSLTIGLAWLYFRPLIGIGVIAVGLAIAAVMATRRTKPAPRPVMT